MLKYRLLFLLIFFKTSFHAMGEEGMWLPQLLKQLNEQDMQSLGMKMSAEDIYSVNKSSLKDAIVSFNGGCTGEIISNEGLLLTNHHCGYGQIQSHSSVENDYLTDGFWAMSKDEELANENLFVTFIIRIEDVTDQMLAGLDALEGKALEDSISARMPSVKEKAVEGTHYEALIKPFFYGNKYYMFVTEKYEDVRLVGAPPSSIGKFGGDTDNWVWPRHTGDFSIFRVYSGPDGKPAKYSEDNIPLKPRHFLPVNIAGINEGDFSMVFGFPGRTQEYLTSYAVEALVDSINPARINIREEKLAIMKAEMDQSDKVRIQYASKYARVANYWKKWIGENRGLKISEAVKVKRVEEKAFQKWADKQGNEDYKNLLTNLEKANNGLTPYEVPLQYMREAIFGIEAFRLSLGLDAKSDASIAKFFKDYNRPTDQMMMKAMLKTFDENVADEYKPEEFQKLKSKFKGDYGKLTDYLFEKSKLTTEKEALAIKSNPKKLDKDPVYTLANAFYGLFKNSIVPEIEQRRIEIDQLQKLYVKGLIEMSPEKKFYPDANSTMRVSYGLIDGNEPEDGVKYTFQTTLEGIIRKNESGNPDFAMPEKLRKLYDEKDYGEYGIGDKMPVCFLASNHTTGGNSGSPIIDANGNLIGLNFDRTWQSTMSDVMYNAEICRNIGVDIRYILFIVDKFAGATHLIEEMNIVKERPMIPLEASKTAEQEALIEE
ncbi:S46 family peptidase [Aureibacter tunicatorum]|uniref:Dipeptidyl-peptidase n=1 Tax=Aureibacter tunicatorum TaxID=866807 RepID=A0AAE3XJV3_9BACT|nr:S46 family peptidase [Aureibacter tunicatorum]MDR6237815.1 hypothetical protein [Aureibacter tunicatorum]BDD02850.1 Asp/Glu-specific dipeptidyl-peptidase [Aureibacter tunicatorum]